MSDVGPQWDITTRLPNGTVLVSHRDTKEWATALADYISRTTPGAIVVVEGVEQKDVSYQVHNHGPEEGPGLLCGERWIGNCMNPTVIKYQELQSAADLVVSQVRSTLQWIETLDRANNMQSDIILLNHLEGALRAL